MPIPVIDVTTSVLAYRKNEYFVYQPAATETPTSWACLGLPEGIDINTTSGKISGAATEPGVYNCTLTAINGTGTSLPLFLAMGIEAGVFETDSSIEVNIDLNTGLATVADTKANIIYGKRGDKLIISVGFTKGGFLNDLELARIDLSFKEFEPEALVSISDGTYEKLGSFDTARYRFVVALTDELITTLLTSYEDDKNTSFDAVTEIRWGETFMLPGAEVPSILERSSQNLVLRLARDIAPDIEDE